MADRAASRRHLAAAPAEPVDPAVEGSTPRTAHLEMVGAVLAGDGLERVAEIASSHAGAPVAVIVPRLGAPVEGWGDYERYVGARLAGGRPQAPEEIKLEVPISSGGRELGAVLMLGRGSKDAGEYLHMAAIAALTEVAVVEARDETEQSLRGSFLEEALTRIGHGPRRRGAARGPARVRPQRRLHGALRRPGRIAAPAGSWRRWPPRCRGCSPSRWTARSTRCFPAIPILPGAWPRASGRHATVGLSSHYAQAADLTRALEEAELVLGVTAAGGGTPVEEIGGGTYRLLFRVMASHPQEVRSFYEDTVSALVKYDEQYSTDLLGTLDAYLENNCNMNATAQAIHAHRHTVGYRLERVKELTGLDPLTSEDRERLGLGLKAYRIIAPSLPR